MKLLILSFLALSLLVAQTKKQQFMGRITDSMCARSDHSQMKMGNTDAECTIACVRAHGALYVLFDGKQAYELGDQEIAEKFAGQKVKVTGTLDTKSLTIRNVENITVTR